MKRFLIALALSLGLVGSATATTVVSIGSNNQAASATNVLTTTTNACVAGSTIVLASSYVVTADTLASVTDSAGNTWRTPFDNIAGTGVAMGFAYAPNIAVDVPVGSTITATFNGSTNTEITALCIRTMFGTVSTDTTNQTSQGLASTSATTVNTGTLATSTDVVMGFVVAPTSQGTTTCNGSFTKTGSFVTTPSITACVQVVSSNASVAFSPTWTNSVNYVSNVMSFKGVTGTCFMTTLGTGAC